MSFTVQDSFRKTFQNQGGEFDFSGIEYDLLFLFEDPISYSSAGLDQAKTRFRESFPFHIGFIANPTFNAAAADTPWGGLIGLNYSIPFLLMDACLTYADICDLEIKLPNLNERLHAIASDQPLDIPQQLDVRLWQDHLYKKIETLLGADEGDARLKFALNLYTAGSLFIVMHESLHVILGHAAWFQQNLGTNVLLEFSSLRSQMRPRDSQAIEYLADINSAAGLVSSLERDLSKMETVGRPRCEAVKLVSQGAAIVLHLLPSSYQKNDAFGRHRSHPHPYVRMQWINSLLLGQVEEGEIQAVVMQPFAHATVALDHIFHGKDRWIEVNQINLQSHRPITEILLNRVIRHSSVLQEQFWPYAPEYQGFTRGWPNEPCEHMPQD